MVTRQFKKSIRMVRQFEKSTMVTRQLKKSIMVTWQFKKRARVAMQHHIFQKRDTSSTPSENSYFEIANRTPAAPV